MKLTRSRGPDCVSDLAFDRWYAGELSAEEIAPLADHLSSCTRCAERRASLTDQGDAFAAGSIEGLRARAAANAQVNPETGTIATLVERRSRLPRWPAAAAVLALAAGVVLASKVRKPDEIDSNERSKGAARFVYYVHHDGVVTEGLDGETLSPGDAIQLSYSVARSGYLAIFSVDGARRASTYWPRGEHAAPIGLGRDVSLPESIVLDGTVGPETIYTLFCAEPVRLEPIRSALERSPEREAQIEGCTTDRVRFIKVDR